MSERLHTIFGFAVDVYEGRPVENDKIFFICKGKKVTENFSEISDEFYLTETSQISLPELLKMKFL